MNIRMRMQNTRRCANLRHDRSRISATKGNCVLQAFALRVPSHKTRPKRIASTKPINNLHILVHTSMNKLGAICRHNATWTIRHNNRLHNIRAVPHEFFQRSTLDN